MAKADGEMSSNVVSELTWIGAWDPGDLEAMLCDHGSSVDLRCGISLDSVRGIWEAAK